MRILHSHSLHRSAIRILNTSDFYHAAFQKGFPSVARWEEKCAARVSTSHQIQPGITKGVLACLLKTSDAEDECQ